jgi:hypothetical protein
MRTALMAVGADVWNSVITGYSPPKKARTIAQKVAKKNNSMAMETILKGMTDSVKEKIGQHISAKDLWLNVEQLYSIEGQEVKDNLIKDSASDHVNLEGMPDSDLSLYKVCDYDISDNKDENKEDCFLDKEYYSENGDEGIVDLEIELIEALKEIQRLRKTIKRQATNLTQLDYQKGVEDNDTKENISSENYKSEEELIFETNYNDLVNTQEELKKEREEKALLTITLQNKEERCQAQEYEIASLKEKLKETIQLNSDMNQEEKNLKEQLQEKEEFFQKNTLEILALQEEVDEASKSMTDLRRHSEEMMKTKESEIIGLRTEVATLTEELNKLRTNENISTNTEKNLKIQLFEKDESCHLLDLKIEDLRKKNKNENMYIKFEDSSAILDKILHSQRSPSDKSGLGFNNTVGEIKLGKKTPSWKYEMNIPYSRRQSEFINQEHAHYPVNEKSYKRNVQKGNQNESFSCQDKSGKDTSSRWKQMIRCGNYFYGYCFSCYAFGHRASECQSHGKIRSGKYNHSMKYKKYKYNELTGNYCYITRCYTCNGLGHKAHECRNSKGQSMENISFRSERKFSGKARFPIQKATKVWRRKSEEQKEKNYELSTYVNDVCSRHIELKHVIENSPENISDRNASTDKCINVPEDLHRKDKYKSII